MSEVLTASPASIFDWESFLKNAYVSPLYEDIEKNVRIAAERVSPNDHESFYTKFIAIGVVCYKHDIIWSAIFRSQFLLLEELNSKGFLPLTAAKPFYEEAIVKYPAAYTNYSFEQWLDFLKSQGLLLHHQSDMLEITNYGKDFLRYSAHTGRRADGRTN